MHIIEVTEVHLTVMKDEQETKNEYNENIMMKCILKEVKVISGVMRDGKQGKQGRGRSGMHGETRGLLSFQEFFIMNEENNAAQERSDMN